MSKNTMNIGLGLLLVVFCASASFGFEGIHGGGHGKPKVNYDSLFEAATPLAQSPEGQAVVARCLEAYGGLETLQNIESLTLEYQTEVAFSPHKSTTKKYLAPGRRHRATRVSPGYVKERLLNGNQAWRIINDSSISLSGPDYCGQLFSYFTLQLPALIQTGSFSEVRHGVRENDSLDYIYMMVPDTLLLVAGISKNGSVLVSSEGITLGGESQAVYVNLFSAWGRVDGYLMAHRLINISLGLEVGKSTLLKAEINPTLVDETFQVGHRPEESR